MAVWQSFALMFVAGCCISLLGRAAGVTWWFSAALCFLLGLAWPSMRPKS